MMTGKLSAKARSSTSVPAVSVSLARRILESRSAVNVAEAVGVLNVAEQRRAGLVVTRGGPRLARERRHHADAIGRVDELEQRAAHGVAHDVGPVREDGDALGLGPRVVLAPGVFGVFDFSRCVIV